MSIFKKILILLLVFSISAIIFFNHLTKEDDETRTFFASENLNFTGIVKIVKPTNEHDFGVIYLQNIISNKDVQYESSLQNKYLFCKINNAEAIIVTPGISEIEPNDSISVNTSQSKYWIYKKGVLISKINFWLNKDDAFYNSLTTNDYLDFSYFHKK